MNCKIKETNEIKKLEMIDPATGTDNVVDFIGNNGGFTIINGHFIYDDETGMHAVSLADYEWWCDVIKTHSALDARIHGLIKEHGRAEVMDAINDAYMCDLEDQPNVANQMLTDAFGA